MIGEIKALNEAMMYAMGVAMEKNVPAHVSVKAGTYYVEETVYNIEGRYLCAVDARGNIAWARGARTIYLPKGTYAWAKLVCHVRSAIRRQSKPGAKYWKNHDIPLDERVPAQDQLASDWEEYDPRDHPKCSEYNEMPA